MHEIEALTRKGVWEVAPVSQCLTRTQRRPIRGRWVDIIKGDDIVENYRSRYVALQVRQQYGGYQREGLFAAMPPLEALRIIVSRTTSRGMNPCKNPHRILFMGISKAYLHSDVDDQDLYVELPKEMDVHGMCGHLKKALYGTRGAIKCWEKEYTKTFLELGFVKGKFSPCLFLHPSPTATTS